MNNIFENIDTICFTGPRPAKLYGYTKKEEYQKIVDQLKEVIRGFAKFGIKNYITGGAQGFDQLAFWAVNSLKKRIRHSKYCIHSFSGTGTFVEENRNVWSERLSENACFG